MKKRLCLRLSLQTPTLHVMKLGLIFHDVNDDAQRLRLHLRVAKI